MWVWMLSSDTLLAGGGGSESHRGRYDPVLGEEFYTVQVPWLGVNKKC